VLTGLFLALYALSNRRAELRQAREAASELGLRPIGLQPLPPLTPALLAAEPAEMLVSDDGLRLAHVHLGRRRDVAVCIADLAEAPKRPERVPPPPPPPGRDPAEPHGAILARSAVEPDVAADPHDLVGAETRADPDLAQWVAEHPLDLALVAGAGTLLVAAAAPREEGPPFALLLDAAREARTRV
jgi:hypothetical protein